MPNRASCMIYGANGFTGRLTTDEAIRHGLRPVLAGRGRQPIEAMAADLGLASRVFDLGDSAASRAALADIFVVANCAGPFSATSRLMIDACLEAGAHYLDITGEIDVFLAARSRHDAARAAGIVICPGVGFDVVPTDCLAAVLKETLPDATCLALGFDAAAVPSAGTAKTVVEGLGRGCRIRENGEILEVPFGQRTRRIDFGNGETLATTISWGDVATAYFSTGIPNIEIYVPASPGTLAAMRVVNFARPVLATGLVQDALKRLVQRGKGPSEARLHGERAYVWGEVRNAAGQTRSARTTTPNGYLFTASSTVMAIEHVLAQMPTGGTYTPSQLMGPRSVERVPGVEPIRVE